MILAISRRNGSKLDKTTASGVSSIIKSTPVIASNVLIFLPSRPIILPLISSFGKVTTVTVCSFAKSAAYLCIECTSKSFAVLSQEEQKYANIFLHDVECGNVKVESGKTFRDYVTEYQAKAKNDQIHKMAEILGADEKQLRELISANPSENNINEYGRFDRLVDTVDATLARKYFEETENIKLKPFQVKIKADNLLREFILNQHKAMI